MLSITFKREITALGTYINDCCYGGDVVIGWLQNMVLSGSESVESGQEDWGWYKWYHQKNQRIEVNVCCQDRHAGEYEVQLYFMKKAGWISWNEEPDDISSIGEIVCAMLRDNGCVAVAMTDEGGRK